METVSIKVNFRGKNIIIGKGIESENRIFEELEKRFPQIARFKNQLQCQFQESAKNLNQAYELAQRSLKKSIKVKVFQARELERTVKIEIAQIESLQQDILSQSVRQQSSTSRKINLQLPQQPIHRSKNEEDNIENILDLIQKKSNASNLQEAIMQQQIANKKQGSIHSSTVKSDSLISLKSEDEGESIQSSLQNKKKQRSLSRQRSSSEANSNIKQTSKMSAENLNTIKEPQKMTEQQSKQEQQKKQDQKPNNSQNDGQKNKIKYAKSDQSCLTSNNSQNLKENQQNKPEINNHNPIDVQLVRDLQLKVKHLERKYSDLQAKHTTLQTKFQKLLKSIEKGQLHLPISQKASHKQELMNQGYERIPLEQSMEKSTLTKNTKVDIFQIQTKFEIQVGEKIQPKFRLINSGKQKWPENVFAMDKQTMEQIEIRSLSPGQELVVSFGEQNGLNAGDKIQKIYQLIFYNKKGQMTQFGRTFGVFVNVCAAEKKKNIFEGPKVNRFQVLVVNFMNKHHLKGKSGKIVAKGLANLDINEQNFNQFQDQTLLDIVRSI